MYNLVRGNILLLLFTVNWIYIDLETFMYTAYRDPIHCFHFIWVFLVCQ